jgi:hypothetical protein
MKPIRFALAVILVVLCVATAALTASGRLWWKSDKYRVVVNGLGTSMIAYSGNNVLLVDTNTTQGYSYVVYPQRHELGVAELHRFVHFPGGVLSLDKPATYIPIGKFEVPVEMQFGNNQVRFLGVRSEEIIVRW